MRDNRIITEEELAEAMKHIDAACTIMGWSIKRLFSTDDEDLIVGLKLESSDLAEGYIDFTEEDGVWSLPTRPIDPKQLN